MKRYVLGFGIVLISFVLVNCGSEDISRTRNLQINPIDLSIIENGTYFGDYTYGNLTYKVKVIIYNHEYSEIVVLQNSTTKHAKMAEGVIKRVIEEQTNDVEVITGATTTSKAFLKAIENALFESSL